MIPNPEINVLPHQAKVLLDKGSPLNNFSISGVLEIDAGSEWKNEVFIENCIVDNLKCLMIYFQKKVTIKDCYLRDASFNFSYFLGGLLLRTAFLITTLILRLEDTMT
jgi:hypothetical protein